jgi:hypothetical protein
MFPVLLRGFGTADKPDICERTAHSGRTKVGTAGLAIIDLNFVDARTLANLSKVDD